MLLDEFLPVYDFSERHEAVVDAPADAVRLALQEWQPDTSLLWRGLLVLRGLGSPNGSLRQWAEGMGFICLAEGEDEMVYGQIGQFWRLRERAALISPRTASEFLEFDEPGFAVAAMSIGGEARSEYTTSLFTETRIRALGPAARRRFRLYWLAIRPFSGLLRRSMLHGVKRLAEDSFRRSLRRPAGSGSLDGTP